LKFKNNYGWPRNWSSRGVAMMNSVESFTTTDVTIKKYRRTNRVKSVSISEKLNYLISIKPERRFYQSLSTQLKSGKSLSLKQIQAIGKDYNMSKY
jgi:hypothetical protein